MNAAEAMLAAEGLAKSYGPIRVLHGVDVTVARQESHVVIGPNGAGKTTLFKVLTGELRSDAGRIRFEGEDVTRLPAHGRVHRGFGRTFQVARVFPRLTVRDNLQLAAEARLRRANPLAGLTAGGRAEVQEQCRAVLADTGLQRHAGSQAAALAYGDRKRLELAMVLVLRPTLLFLDEPTAGMSAAERLATVQLLRDLRQRHGFSMLLTEHDMEVVFGLADRISVLHHGELIASGTPQQIRADASVREVYLGDGDGHA
jgi:branched-chain amino acid transport system ATP-binding protein